MKPPKKPKLSNSEIGKLLIEYSRDSYPERCQIQIEKGIYYQTAPTCWSNSDIFDETENLANTGERIDGSLTVNRVGFRR